MTLFKDFDIKPRLTIVENPQGNLLVERIHQVVQNMIKIKELDKLIFDYIYPWAEILGSIAWAIPASAPAQLVFGRDMLFNMKKVINWKMITENKHKQIARNNARENTGRIKHTYNIGDEVLHIKRGIKRKYSRHKTDPYYITDMHANGTVTIAQGMKH